MVSTHRQTQKQQRLAQLAVSQRLRALNEYLAVYRAAHASEADTRSVMRIRELRSDVARLAAWGWYMAAREKGAPWLALIDRLASVLAVLVPGKSTPRRRRASGAAMQHLSSYSLVERSYAALEDDLQGQLLTLQLASRQRPNRDYQPDIEALNAQLADLAALRLNGLPSAAEVTVICNLLRGLLAVRSALGLSAATVQSADS